MRAVIRPAMQVAESWTHVRDRAGDCPLVLGIGAFDGIHIGHQMLIRRTIEHARSIGGEAWLLTFDPHPSRVLRPANAPLLLTSTPHKRHLLAPLGLDGVIFHPFTRALAACAPEAFLEELMSAMPRLHTLVVGPNWRFGRRASGDVALLEQLAEAHGLAVMIPETVSLDGVTVSSTRIRRAVESGHLEEAERMLGRPFSLLGTVTTGRQYGRELGFPTANIRLQEEARPPTGVYAVYGIYNGERHNGAAYLGIRPTAHGVHTHHLLEVHLFDVDIDLYGKEIEVSFIKFLRGDQRFIDHEALKAQIAKDVQQSRDLFASGNCGGEG